MTGQGSALRMVAAAFVVLLVSIGGVDADAQESRRMAMAPSMAANETADHEAWGAVADMIAALEYFDLEAFVGAFSDDATVFFPQPGATRRLTGHAEIRATMVDEFARARERVAAAGIEAPPYLGIEPTDIATREIAANTVLVTWHADRRSHAGRRTAIVQMRDGAWRIVSLHSSNMAWPKVE